MFSKKATKIYEIFTVDLTLCSKCQIDGEDFANFCGLLGKYELYPTRIFLLTHMAMIKSFSNCAIHFEPKLCLLCYLLTFSLYCAYRLQTLAVSMS